MINLYDILEASDGQLFGEPHAQIFSDFCFDSRRVEPGQIFVALKTERGDGHAYIGEAVAGGATGVLCQHPPEDNMEGVTCVVVRDTQQALMQWAQRVLRRYGTTVIGVTGSVGKTTAKEAIAAILSTKYKVYKSPGSFNGRLGVPLSLGKLGPEHQLAVLELATDHFGEMAELVEMTRPVVGVVTAVGHSHLEALGSLENVAREKGVLIESLPENGLAVLNYDDDRVREMASRTKAPVMTVGLDVAGPAFGADLLAYNIVVSRFKTGFDLRYRRQRFVGRWTPLLGQHQLYGLLAALAVGLAYDVPLEEGLQVLTGMEPLPGRMRLLEGKNGALIVDDTFSATPESTLVALEWLETIREENGRLIFVMGNMDQLGSYARPAHQIVGRRAAEVADKIVTFGEMAATVGRTAIDFGFNRDQVRITFSHADAASCAAEDLGPDDVVLIKGSASARMERVVKALLANPEDSALLVRQEPAWQEVWLDRPARPTWLEIDLDGTANNVRLIKEIIGPDVALMAVVKANAYGHGAVGVSTTALLNGAEYLGVASINEAIELREAGIDDPILILGFTPAWAARQAIINRITVTLFDVEMARQFDRAAGELNSRAKVHVKVDTGMGRLGLLPDQVPRFFRHIERLKNIEVEGIFTHFSVADEDLDYTRRQLDRFNYVLELLKAAGIRFKYVHAANTAATLRLPESHFNMVRVGIGMHGLAPSEQVQLPEGFRPTMSWKTSIAQVKTLPPGSYVSYGNTYITKGTERIAVIPVGYADGFRRSPRNWGEVLVHGQRAPIVGRVCMDQTMINVSHIPDVRIGDEVVLIGRQGDDEITADEVAKRLGTINYEVVSVILSRVPRGIR